jgi:DNA-nicking Smr family endonuclease
VHYAEDIDASIGTLVRLLAECRCRDFHAGAIMTGGTEGVNEVLRPG